MNLENGLLHFDNSYRPVLENGLLHFDNGYRPVQLSQQYIGIEVRKPLQRFQLMNDLCYENVMALAGKH